MDRCESGREAPWRVTPTRRLCRCQGSADFVCGRAHLLVVFVLRTWPEEALQTVALRAGHDVNMKVRDALADDVVHRDERSLRAERLRNGAGDRLHAFEERPNVFGREIKQSDDVGARDNEDVPEEEGGLVEERERNLV